MSSHIKNKIEDQITSELQNSSRGFRYLIDSRVKLFLLISYLFCYFSIPFFLGRSEIIIFSFFTSIVVIITIFYLYTWDFKIEKFMFFKKKLPQSLKNRIIFILFIIPVSIFAVPIIFIFFLFIMLPFYIIIVFGAYFWTIFEPIIYLTSFSGFIYFLNTKTPVFVKRYSLVLLIIISGALIAIVQFENSFTMNYDHQEVLMTELFEVEAGALSSYSVGLILLIVTVWIFYVIWYRSKSKRGVRETFPLIQFVISLIFTIIIIKYIFIDSSTNVALRNLSQPTDLLISFGAVIIALWKVSRYATAKFAEFSSEPKRRDGLGKLFPITPIHPYVYVLLIYPVSILQYGFDRTFEGASELSFGMLFLTTPIGFYILIKEINKKFNN